MGVPNPGLAIHTAAKRTTEGHSIATHPSRDPSAGPHPGRKCRPYGAVTKKSSGKTAAAENRTIHGAMRAKGWIQVQNEFDTVGDEGYRMEPSALRRKRDEPRGPSGWLVRRRARSSGAGA